MADLLFEIGLEEVPARMIAGAQAELERRIQVMLIDQRLLAGTQSGFTTGFTVDIKSYSTPRRLAVVVRNVLDRQDDITEEVVGPAVKIAYKDGVATPAAEAFARKSGVAVGDLKIVLTPKGEYIAATSVKAGRGAAQVIAEWIPKELAAIYWAKNMYWRAGKPERFVRPVLWLVCLLGDEVVPVSFGGRTAGRATFGHRVLSSGEAFEIEAPESYEAQLAGEYVLVDVEARRRKIRKALDKVTREVDGARWREDEALVDQVTHLTEWPDVLLGGFEAEYLELPEEVLVTVMRDHQKYFAVEDSAGKLAPHFLVVLNISTDESSAAIIRQGNERVLRARFNDARFFWEFDQRVPLVDRVKLLESVTFQKDLGSYAAKTERVLDVAGHLAQQSQRNGQDLDTEAVLEAVRLAKADLTTELVKEFTELQGVIGGLYARSQGASDVVSNAIYDQYVPVNMEDRVPRSLEGAILGIADRSSTVASLFSIGLEPSGSKDPFALRRAANGIIKILAETNLPLTISSISDAASQFSNSHDLFNKVKAFIADRLDFYLREVRGQTYDVVAAVLAAGADDVRDAVARAEAVSSVRGGEDFAAVSAAFKRMKNILEQARAKGDDVTASVDGDLLVDASEKMLAVMAEAAASAVEVLQGQRRYAEALREIAMLRPAIDDFFEKVMVMSPELDIRANRLALLARTLGDFSKIADFSEIVVAG